MTKPQISPLVLVGLALPVTAAFLFYAAFHGAKSFFVSSSDIQPAERTSPKAATTRNSIGMIPLPEREALLETDVGRPDPFAPLASPDDATPITVLDKPEDVDLPVFANLSFTGFVKDNRGVAGLVTFDGSSGEVKVGDIGGQTTPFLPDDWKVVSINTKKGEMALVNISTRRRAYLSI